VKIGKWFSESFAKNPVAWFLLAACILAEYGNYTTGRDLNRVCDLLGDHVVWVAHPTTPRQEIDNICLDHDPDQVDPDQ
jgi:hypothetical protein